jgi:hypothetical protein
MSNQTFAIILGIVAVICLTAGALFYKGCLMPKPLPLPRVVHDTTYLPGKPIVETKNHYIPYSVTDTIKLHPEFTFKDSIRGSQDSVGYKVIHTATFLKDSVKSVFDVEIKPFIKVITDSLFIPQIVLQNKPILQDGFFYSSMGLFLLSVLYLIGIL